MSTRPPEAQGPALLLDGLGAAAVHLAGDRQRLGRLLLHHNAVCFLEHGKPDWLAVPIDGLPAEALQVRNSEPCAAPPAAVQPSSVHAAARG